MTTQLPNQFNSSQVPQQDQSVPVPNSQGVTEKTLDSASLVERQKEEASVMFQETSQEKSTQAPHLKELERTRAVPELINAIKPFIKTIKPFIWAIVVMIVLIPLIGKLLISHAFPKTHTAHNEQPITKTIVEPSPNWNELDQAVSHGIREAHVSAQNYASGELDAWNAELIPRLDNFLDWYFNFANQKQLEFKSPFIWVFSGFSNEAIAESFTQEFQREFAKRVLLPREAQLRLELITTDTVNRYLAELSKNITTVQTQFKIPRTQWERYLGDISTTINDTEGNISNLSLKVLVGGSGYLVAKPLIAVSIAKLGGKLGAKLAGGAIAKMAAKTGAAVGAELGTSLIDPIVGIGILLWDVWDYKHTVKTERPILKENLQDYLKLVKTSLLTDPESGVMAAINQVEHGIIKAI